MAKTSRPNHPRLKCPGPKRPLAKLFEHRLLHQVVSHSHVYKSKSNCSVSGDINKGIIIISLFTQYNTDNESLKIYSYPNT